MIGEAKTKIDIGSSDALSKEELKKEKNRKPAQVLGCNTCKFLTVRGKCLIFSYSLKSINSGVTLHTKEYTFNTLTHNTKCLRYQPRK